MTIGWGKGVHLIVIYDSGRGNGERTHKALQGRVKKAALGGIDHGKYLRSRGGGTRGKTWGKEFLTMGNFQGVPPWWSVQKGRDENKPVKRGDAASP